MKATKMILTMDGLVPEMDYVETTLEDTPTVYEVIRIIDGVALFLEDHHRRLLNSINIQGLEFRMSFPEFKQHIAMLISTNNQTEGNVKFICWEFEEKINWSFRFIPHSYPSADDYKNGVVTDLLFAERTNPNAKVVQQTVRNEANRLIGEKGLYEVLLVDRNGLITEGSRSNVFFIRDGVFYTAPASMVLVGVTRQKVLECLAKLHLEVVEQAVASSGIGSFDAAIITGTSPRVLPIRTIGNQAFDVGNPSVLKLMEGYNQLLSDYILKKA
jgi:branched-chain amino acid aminotransferase